MAGGNQTQAFDGHLQEDAPVVGAIATGENDEEIARIYTRATARGYDVLVACDSETRFGIPELGDLDGGSVIRSMDGMVAGDPTTAGKQRLIGAAQSQSATGLIFVEDTSTRINFAASQAAVDQTAAFVASAVPETATTETGTLVAIPAYNEAGTIASVVTEARAVADEVVVIDDGSTDGTAEKAESAGATVVSHGTNSGYGGALQTAFETADSMQADRLVIIDGDGQHEAADIPRLEAEIRDGDANVAIGSRFKATESTEIPLYRRVGLGVVNTLTNVSMGFFHPREWVTDTQSGFRAYDRHAIEELATVDLSDGMDASLEILYQLQDGDFEIAEVPTVVDYTVENGHSKNPVSHGFGLVASILRTVEREHPILLLGVPGFIAALVGLVFGYMTVTNYITTQTFPLGLALSSVFTILLGVFSCFTAIMLHSVQAHLGDLDV
jgi:glycosyltransferase involved in cell wall biosynthesis